MSVKKKSNQNEQASEFMTETVCVRRTSKVNRGGRTFGFSALVVSGDGAGKVGFGLGSSPEVPSAIQKATTESQRNMIRVPLVDDTIQHTIRSRHGASKVLMMPAPAGTGIIAGNAMRAIFKVMGVENILAKSLGSSNPINVIRATFRGLHDMKTPEMVARKRGKSVKEVIGDENESS